MADKYHVLVSGKEAPVTSYVVTTASFDYLKKHEKLASDDYTIAEFYVRSGQTEAEAQLLASLLTKHLNELHEAQLKLIKMNYMRPTHAPK